MNTGDNNVYAVICPKRANDAYTNRSTLPKNEKTTRDSEKKERKEGKTNKNEKPQARNQFYLITKGCHFLTIFVGSMAAHKFKQP